MPFTILVDQTCSNHADIQAYFENAWNIVKDEKYEAQNVVWLYQHENSAACIYTYFFEGYIHVEYVNGKGRATNILIKEDVKWLLTHEYLSPIPQK